MTKKKDNPQPGGRPSKIKSINMFLVKSYSARGYTDAELAKIFNVCEDTINNWKKDYPEFFESLKSGKMLADCKVEASLYQRACGYSHPEVHISSYLGAVIKTPIIKHYPPDPTAMIFWLKNRKPGEWRENNVEKRNRIMRVGHYRRKYGISIEDYEKLLIKQG